MLRATRVGIFAAAACEVTGPGTTVRLGWSINGSGEMGCPTVDTCEDVDAENVLLRWSDRDELWPCGPTYAASVGGLALGQHRVTLTLVDASAVPLTKERDVTFDVDGQAGVDICVNFPASSFLEERQGVFRFEVRWGEDELGCKEAGVHTVRIDDKEIPCTDEEQGLSERTWGPAELAVVGLDSEGAILYESNCGVTIGAGKNPSFRLQIGSNTCLWGSGL